MKNLLILIALLFFSTSLSFSQIVFEEGYFIDEANQKTVCLIKNIGWKNNPTKFSYKLSADDSVKEASLENIVEFGINETSKFIRVTVQIDRSRNDLGRLSESRNPEFQEEVLFLKVIVEGDVSLYLYEHGNLKRFFFKTEGSEISQLVFKHYKKDNVKAVNNYFQQQLFNEVNCEGEDLKNFEKIRYSKKELERVFINFNNCKNGTFRTYESPNDQKNLINLSIRPGVRLSSLSIESPSVLRKDVDFDREIGYRLGLEAEFIMPYNKNKWAIIIEPTFQVYNPEGLSVRNIPVTVNYKSIELPIGLRHYFFLDDKSRIFLNGSYVVDFALNSSVEYQSGSDVDLTSRSNFAFGLGYKQNKYSVEFRYHTNRDVVRDLVFWTSNYQVFSIIFGYSFF